MTTQELLASLTAVHGEDGTSIAFKYGYADWSTRDDDGNRVLELGDDESGATQVPVTHDDLLQLHQLLTLTLLRDAQEG